MHAKSCLVRFPISAAALAVGVVFSACSKQDQQKVTTAATNAYEDTKAAAERTWDKVRAATWDKRSDFTASANALSAKAEEQARELHTKFAETKASASRQAAMDEFKNSQADYKSKLDALGTATADTWESAKQNVILAWDKMQSAYYKARAD